MSTTDYRKVEKDFEESIVKYSSTPSHRKYIGEGGSDVSVPLSADYMAHTFNTDLRNNKVAREIAKIILDNPEENSFEIFRRLAKIADFI